MGDRGNINVRNTPADNGVFLYSHWGGSDLPKVLQRALKRGESRWGDTPYLTRIIFCEMLKGLHYSNAETVLDDTTGFGIDTEECDPEHPTIVVDTTSMTVKVRGQSYTFPDYIRADIR